MSAEIIGEVLREAEAAVVQNHIPRTAKVAERFFAEHTAGEIDTLVADTDDATVADLVRLAHIHVDSNVHLTRRALTPAGSVAALEAAADTIFKVYDSPDVVNRLNSAQIIEMQRDRAHAILAAVPLYDPLRRPDIRLNSQQFLSDRQDELLEGDPLRPLLAIETQLVAAPSEEVILAEFAMLAENSKQHPEPHGIASGLLSVWGQALHNQALWNSGVDGLREAKAQKWQDKAANERFSLGSERRQNRTFGRLLPVTRGVAWRRDRAMEKIAFKA